MASENETVADIVKRVRRDCNSYPLPTAAAEMLKLVREVEAAYQREVAVVLKDRDEMFKSEQETVAKTKEWFDEYQKLKREVSELRECLKEAFEEKCSGTKPCDGCWCHQSCKFEKWRKALKGVNHEKND